MGNQFWETMLSSPDTFSTSLTKDQLKMMRRSTFIVHFDSDESGSVAKTTAEDHSLSELDEEEEEEEMTSSEEEADTSSFKFGDTLKVELQPAERAKSPANKSAQRLDQVLTTEKK